LIYHTSEGFVVLPPLAGWFFVDWTWAVVVPLFQILGLFFAFHAIMNSRTPQAAIGWLLGLVVLPYIAIPLYLVFGQSRFSGYTLAGHGFVHGLDQIKLTAKVHMEAHRCHFREAFEDLTRLCERLSGLPTTSGNSLELLIDGEQTFDAIFRSMRLARDSIIAQFYVIHDDELGAAFQGELLAARARGVEVYLLYDGVGSKHLPPAYVDRLRRAGCHIEAFVTNRELGVRFQINFRNHRKLVLVDGCEAFTGGLNVGDEYMGRSKRFGPWRDTHLRVRGPALLPLFVGFAEDWHYATGNILPLPVPTPSTAGKTHVLSFVSGPADEIEICPVIYLSAIREARRRIWIASPYLVPDAATRLALQHAALRGVDVRILLPGIPDHTLPWLTSYSYYPALRQAGVRLFRTKEGFMHQKVLLVDNDLAMVGSINFDHRSFMLNFEHAVMACDSAFALDVHHMLQRDFANSKEENLEAYEKGSFFFRLKVRLAALTSPEQ
jgi:cardiolipin synthase A/B